MISLILLKLFTFSHATVHTHTQKIKKKEGWSCGVVVMCSNTLSYSDHMGEKFWTATKHSLILLSLSLPITPWHISTRRYARSERK